MDYYIYLSHPNKDDGYIVQKLVCISKFLPTFFFF